MLIVRALAGTTGKGQERGSRSTAACAATESQASQRNPAGTRSPDLGSPGWPSSERHHGHHGKGLVFLGVLSGVERSIAVRKTTKHPEDGL